MKKNIRKIISLVVIIVCGITLYYTNFTNSSAISSFINPEALAGGENSGLTCEDAPGFCIIDGLPVNGVTYKE